MAKNLLTIAQDNRTNRIGIWLVLKNDFGPWFASTGVALLLFAGVTALMNSVRPDMSSTDVSANLYTWARPFYYALIILAVLLARRSRDIWTWILTGVLIVFFIPQITTNLATAILPNSIFQAMIAMLGFLAVGRIIEYVRMRYIIGLMEPTLSIGVLVSYSILVCSALLFDIPFSFELFWH